MVDSFSIFSMISCIPTKPQNDRGVTAKAVFVVRDNTMRLSPSEYIFKTQPENLAATGAEIPGNITFITYAKLMLMDGNGLAGIRPGYIILDEFHRCGAAEWGKGVQNLLNMYPDVPVLGLSATNIRYLDNQRDMADELFGGNVASEMTLGEAIVRGIWCMLSSTIVHTKA